jgi:hypothetical protein
MVIEADANAPLKYLEEMFQTLMFNKSGNSQLSVKWDGSPAFVCGEHPEDGEFFVGTKSAFTGKACRTKEEIDKFYGDQPELVAKLKSLFQHLRPYNWKGVTQGDLLWTEDSKVFDYNGFWFQPNCLKYHFPFRAGLEVGVVLHTTYTGKTFKDMEAQFCASIPSSYWMGSADTFIFEPNLVVLEPLDEKDILDTLIRSLTELEKRAVIINRTPEILKVLREPKALTLFLRFVNFQIKNPQQFNFGANEFIEFIEEEYTKHINSLKTAKGKKRLKTERSDFLYSIGDDNLWQLFSFYRYVVYVKETMVGWLDRKFSENIDYGWKITLPDNTPCGHEGYVLSIDNKPVKFVNRSTFSKANFDLQRSWK